MCDHVGGTAISCDCDWLDYSITPIARGFILMNLMVLILHLIMVVIMINLILACISHIENDEDETNQTLIMQ